MKLVDHSFLKLVTNEDIQEICRFADLDLLLVPMKAHPVFYKKYTKSLGRLEKKSALVQKLLPKFAFDLYEKGDERYIDVIALIIKSLKENFEKYLEESVDSVIKVEDIKKYTLDEYEVLYNKILDISATNISIEKFFIFLKLNGITFSENEKRQLAEKFHKVMNFRKLAEKFQREKEDEIKKREKELLFQLEQERSLFQRELNKYRKELSDASKREKQFVDELQDIKTKQEKDKQSLITDWIKTAELEASKRKVELDHELEEYRFARINEINDICEKKFTTKELEIQAKLENQEKKFTERLQVIKDSIDRICITKDKLEYEIKVLTEEKSKRKSDLKSLEQSEHNFYSNLKQRALEHRLDTLIFDGEKLESKEQVEKSNSLGDFSISMHRKSNFSNAVERSEFVEEIDDFAEDLKDNICLNFDNSAEISAIIIAALFSGKALVVEDSIGEILVESISALIDSQTTIVIESAGKSVGSFVNTINNLEERVIYIEGVLDDYNEILFENLCRECSKKYLFFGVSDVSNIKMLSKNIYNYAIVLDLESELHFPETDSIFVGRYDIDKFRPNFDRKVCLSYYDKYFRSLVSNAIINQRTCLDLSIMLQTYFYFISNDKLGEMIKRSILICCDYEMDNEDVDKREILSKSGVI